MSYKTEFIYNKDDFKQVGTQMNELTVEITLCEYRNLLKELVYFEATLNRVQKELKEYKRNNAQLADLILSKYKKEIGEIGKIALNILRGDACNEEREENDECNN